MVKGADYHIMTAGTAKGIVVFYLVFFPVLLYGEIPAIGETHPLEYYIDSLFYPAYDPELEGAIDICLRENSTVSLDTVGLLKNTVVVELTYHCSDTEWCDEGKAILFESGREEFGLLYFYVNDCTEVYLQPSGIITVDSVQVLFTRSPITGTGGYVEERYWVWSDTGGIPADLHVEQVTSEALSQVLPENYYVAYGGFFDIYTLSLECYVRRPGDYNCCPTGGWVALKYDIEDCALRVVSCTYDPDRIDTGSESNR